MKHALLALALFATPALAQEGDPADAPGGAGSDEVRGDTVPAERRRLTLALSAEGLFAAETDLDDDGGDVQIWRAGAGVDTGYALTPTLRLAVGASYERSWYDFSGGGDFGSGVTSDDLLEEANLYTVSAALLGQANDRWGWFAGAALVAGFEDGADVEDSLYGRVAGGATYQVNDRLRVGLGVAVSTELEEDGVFVMPFPVVEYRINERLRIGSEDAGLVLAYDATDALELSLRAAFERRQYRLDGDDGALEDGVLVDERVPVAFGIAYRPSPQFELRALAGAYVWSGFELRDDGGDEVADPEADPSFFTGLSLNIRF